MLDVYSLHDSGPIAVRALVLLAVAAPLVCDILKLRLFGSSSRLHDANLKSRRRQANSTMQTWVPKCLTRTQ